MACGRVGMYYQAMDLHFPALGSPKSGNIWKGALVGDEIVLTDGVHDGSVTARVSHFVRVCASNSSVVQSDRVDAEDSILPIISAKNIARLVNCLVQEVVCSEGVVILCNKDTMSEAVRFIRARDSIHLYNVICKEDVTSCDGECYAENSVLHVMDVAQAAFFINGTVDLVQCYEAFVETSLIRSLKADRDIEIWSSEVECCESEEGGVFATDSRLKELKAKKTFALVHTTCESAILILSRCCRRTTITLKEDSIIDRLTIKREEGVKGKAVNIKMLGNGIIYNLHFENVACIIDEGSVTIEHEL